MLGWMRIVGSRIWGWVSGRRGAEEEFARELESHLEMLAQENVRRGMTLEEARRAARVRLGGMTQISEKHREMHTLPLLETFVQDIRYGLRTLRKSPGFTSVAVLTLALGIGANTAIFTLLHASLWKPLSVNDPKEIFHVMRFASSGDFAGEASYSYPLFQQFSKVGAPWGEVFATEVVGPKKFSLDRISNERIAGEGVSGNFFSVLGVAPFVGRVLEAQDDNVLGGNHVAVLSYSFWKRRFQSDASVLGKTIFYDENPYSVIGIAPPGFTGIEQRCPWTFGFPSRLHLIGRGGRSQISIGCGSSCVYIRKLIQPWLKRCSKLHFAPTLPTH